VYGISEHVHHERERNDDHERHYDAPERPDQPSVHSIHEGPIPVNTLVKHGVTEAWTRRGA
jgi:hypothetical protein